MSTDIQLNSGDNILFVESKLDKDEDIEISIYDDITRNIYTVWLDEQQIKKLKKQLDKINYL